MHHHDAYPETTSRKQSAARKGEDAGRGGGAGVRAFFGAVPDSGDIDFHFQPVYDPADLSNGDPVIVCHCRATSDREIRRSVRNGAVTLREVSRACGAASGCGGCAEAVHEVIASELGAFEPRTIDVDLAGAR